MQASFAPALRVRSRCAPRPMRRRRWRTRVCPSAPRTHTRRGPHPAHPTPFRRGMHQQLPACTLLCTDALPFALSVLPLRSHRSSSRRPLAAPSPLTSTLRTLAPPSASAPSRRRLALESVSSSMARRSTTARCSRRLCRRVSRIDPNTHTHTHTHARTHARTHAHARTHNTLGHLSESHSDSNPCPLLCLTTWRHRPSPEGWQGLATGCMLRVHEASLKASFPSIRYSLHPFLSPTRSQTPSANALTKRLPQTPSPKRLGDTLPNLPSARLRA